MIICACSEAKESCELTCEQYRGKVKPKKTYNIPMWKNKRKAALNRIIEYAKSLDWNEEE